MYYLQDGTRPHYVSLKTGKQYFYQQDATGEDRQRALLQLERDDTPQPEPEPEPEPVTQLQPQPQPINYGSHLRMQLDEMKLQSRHK